MKLSSCPDVSGADGDETDRHALPAGVYQRVAGFHSDYDARLHRFAQQVVGNTSITVTK